MIYAVVGSGGKTTLVHKMAEAFRAQKKKVFVTTSTHMRVEEDTILSDDSEVLIAALEKNGYVMAGLPTIPKVLPKGMTLEDVIRNPVKMGGLSLDTYNKVSEAADVTIIEADGSRGLPAKYPNQTEPVIYDNVDEIIVVSGLHGLGRPIGEATFRTDLVLRCLNSEGMSHVLVNSEDWDKLTVITKEGNYALIEPNRFEIAASNQSGMINDYMLVVTEASKLEAWHMQKLVKEGYIYNMKEQFPEKKLSIYPTTDGSLYQRAVAGLMKADLDVDLIKKEWFDQKPCLYIIGAGHVAKEVAEMGVKLDFRVKVLDDRPELANHDRFPNVDEVICDSFENVAKYAEEHAFNVVATYGHKEDFYCVRELMKIPFYYLGMIASRRKVAEFQKLLQADLEAGLVTKEVAEALHSPIGLPIGASTPAEIAVSILAEIIQEKSRCISSSTPQELLESREQGTLCIIIEKSGSSPRGKGTMMLVTEKGILGTVGGGILEAAVIEDARSTKATWTKEYSLNSRDKDRLGMICGGNNTILFIPV